MNAGRSASAGGAKVRWPGASTSRSRTLLSPNRRWTTAVTCRKLALVVATHEHADHISGFASRAEIHSKLCHCYTGIGINLEQEKAVAISD